MCGFVIKIHAQLLPGVAKMSIYIVRHAEKESGNDPGLTVAGRNRAGDLMRTLKHRHIGHIYVSQYRRSQMTADSIRIQLGADTIHYKADTTGIDLLLKIRAYRDVGHSILVIGHSNTIPQIIRMLGVINFPRENIADHEFDNLYLVRYRNHKAYLTRYKYGMPSKPL